MVRRACGGWRRVTLAVVLAVAASGCAVQSAAIQSEWPADLPDRAELDATPFFPQIDYHCGPAALATAVGAAGVVADPAAVAERIFLPARKGTLQVEMIAGVRREGLVATRIPPTLDALLREVAAGNPVVVLQNLGLSISPAWHYAVVVGYDRDAREIVLRSGTVRRELMSMRTFEHTWARAGSWAFVALQPGRWPVTARQEDVVEAAVGFERAATPKAALAAYASGVQRWPAEPVLAVGLGNSAYATGQMALAADAFSFSAQAHRSVPAWINLSRTLLDTGHADAALSAAWSAAELQQGGAWKPALDAVTGDAERAFIAGAKRH